MSPGDRDVLMSEWQSGKEEGGELEGCILMWGGGAQKCRV